MPENELKLRTMLAHKCARATLYTDDGELQCNAELPYIDFLHMTPDEIQVALRERYLKRVEENNATVSLPVKPTPDLVKAMIGILNEDEKSAMGILVVHMTQAYCRLVARLRT